MYRQLGALDLLFKKKGSLKGALTLKILHWHCKPHYNHMSMPAICNENLEIIISGWQSAVKGCLLKNCICAPPPQNAGFIFILIESQNS